MKPNIHTSNTRLHQYLGLVGLSIAMTFSPLSALFTQHFVIVLQCSVAVYRSGLFDCNHCRGTAARRFVTDSVSLLSLATDDNELFMRWLGAAAAADCAGVFRCVSVSVVVVSSLLGNSQSVAMVTAA